MRQFESVPMLIILTCFFYTSVGSSVAEQGWQVNSYRVALRRMKLNVFIAQLVEHRSAILVDTGSTPVENNTLGRMEGKTMRLFLFW